ncbi:Antitoxin [Candidatus Methylobacter favarea]|uniref:Antitoxin n=1 Tax=Candidatus Methylobacter favarea TaxID=2707345 RepID=A0A8S0XE99_9GAMM|nr:type II toxin-antitoxin system prevent-host-death family antitoxin [Candidatus Methylobacter favarea]CAA9889552.1 Antitoxin [Candidatus Methylobacter favarea]
MIAAAEQGEEVLIARNGVPLAKIIRYTAAKVNEPGAWKGQTAYSSGWDFSETNIQTERLFSGADDAPAA